MLVILVAGVALVGALLLLGVLCVTRVGQSLGDWNLPVKISTVVVLLVSIAVMAPISIVEEGHVGVVYRFKKLSLRILESGLNIVTPLDFVEHVQITQQTDFVEKVPCGTKDGTMLVFPRIEVVNQLNVTTVLKVIQAFGVSYDQRLIFDKIKSEMSQHCSKNTAHQVAALPLYEPLIYAWNAMDMNDLCRLL